MRIRKLLSAILILLLFPAFLYADDAAEAFVSTYSNCFNLNLASQSFNSRSLNSNWGDSGYDTPVLLATIGIRGIPTNYNKRIELSVNFISVTSQNWCYILDGNDTRYMRPFGVDVYSRKQKTAGGHADFSDKAGSRAHFGYQSVPNGESITESGVISVEYSTFSDSNAVWWDIALILDPNTVTNGVINYDGTDYYLAVGDTYTATIEINIKTIGTVNNEEVVDIDETYTVSLRGYYDGTTTNPTTTNDSDNLNTNLSITRTAGSDSIDIASLLNSVSQITVANYSFSTNTLSDNNQTKANNNIYFFLSSSSNGAVESGPFTLRHTNANGTTSNRDSAHNAVRFTASINSTNGSRNKDGTTRTVTFDGTDYWGQSEDNYLVVPAKYIVGPSETQVSWPDNGSISIAIPANQSINGTEVTTEGLFAGLYTGNIYVHVVVWD